MTHSAPLPLSLVHAGETFDVSTAAAAAESAAIVRGWMDGEREELGRKIAEGFNYTAGAREEVDALLDAFAERDRTARAIEDVAALRARAEREEAEFGEILARLRG